MQTDRVVAAIDFGTHGTGYAWAVIDPRVVTKWQREINDKDQWAGAKGEHYPKTLSALLLCDKAVAAWGHPASQQHSELVTGWNLEDRKAARERRPTTTEADRKRYEYFYGVKMSLRPREDPARDSADAQLVGIADHLEDPSSVITAYLRQIVQVAVADITGKGYYDESDIRWCLTVPAIWDQWSLQQMRQAAIAAGLPTDPSRLLLIPEPDAAALYCDVVGTTAGDGLDGDVHQGLLRPGMRFLVVDCGGGTADLVSYEIGPDGFIEQLCRPSGGPFGAEYTTRGFLLDALGRRFGGEVNLEDLQLTHAEQFRKLAVDWERSRNRFTVDQQRPVLVDFPDRLGKALTPAARRKLAAAQPDGVDDMIILPVEEVCKLLDAVVDPILARVDEQLAQWDPAPDPQGAGDTVFLVGGFAQSPYLQCRLAEHVNDRLPMRLTQRPERAVLFGAVHYCYDPTLLRARRAKYTYGCKIRAVFVAGDQPDKIVFDEEGAKHSDDRFLRFVAANEKVPVDREVSHQLVPSSSAAHVVTVEFYSTTELDARYVTDPGMKLVGTVTVSLTGAMHLPRNQRLMEIFMKFGEADIQVRGVNVTTAAEATTTLVFESAR